MDSLKKLSKMFFLLFGLAFVPLSLLGTEVVCVDEDDSNAKAEEKKKC